MATYYVKKIDGAIYYKSGSIPTSDDTVAADIKAVITAASAGDSIYIEPGTFTGTELSSTSVLDDINKAFAYFGGDPAYPRDSVVFDFNGVTGNGLRTTVNATSPGSSIIGKLKLVNISTAATNYCLYPTGNNWHFDDITIGGSGYRGLYSSNASHEFNRLNVSSMTHAGIYETAASKFNACIIRNNNINIIGTGAITLNNCILDGSANENVENISTSTVTLNNSIVVNSCSNSNTKYPLGNDSTGSFVINNCLIEPNPQNQSRIYSGTATLSNCKIESPLFVSRRRDMVLGFGVDDYSSLNYFNTVVRPALNAYGHRGTLALSQPSEVTSADWGVINEMVSEGHSIAGHGDKFQNMMTDRNAFTVIYTGSGSACSMSIATSGDWAGNITTTATGASGDDRSIAITDTMGLSSLTALLGSNYTVIINNTDTNKLSLPLKYLSTATYLDIKTSAVQIVFDHTRIAYGEMRDTKALIESKIPGYTVKSWVCPGNASDATLRADLKLMGYKIARGSGISSSSALTSLDIFNIRPYALYALYGNDANPHNTPGKIKQYWDSWADCCGWLGLAAFHYAHQLDEISLDGYQNTVAEAHRIGARVLSMDQAYDYILATSTTVDNKTFTRAFADGSDFHLRSSSPCINAGVALAGLTTDFDGKKLPPNGSGYVPDIGAYDTYEYSQGSLIAKAVIPAGNTAAKISLISVDDAVESMLYIDNGYIKAFDGVNTASLDISALAAGEHVFTVRWDYSLGTMAVGMVGLGSVTWGSDATYRGFWETDLSEYIRCFYAGGNYPMYIKSIIMLSSRVLNDTELIYYTNN